MKLIQISLIIALLCCSVYSSRNQTRTAGMNPYKTDLKVKHSLFREKDALERMSSEAVGIPPPKDKKYIFVCKYLVKTKMMKKLK